MSGGDDTPAVHLRPPLEEVDGIVGFLAAEGIVPGARVLDIPCGIGRRALGLAATGFAVTAVDSNPLAIAAAKARTPGDLAPRLEFIASPLGTLPRFSAGERFDAILCLDHPLGRRPAEDEIALLTSLAGYVREGGRLVLDLLHRDFFSARKRPFAFHAIGPVEQHEFRTFDPRTGVLRLEWKFYERVGEDLKHRSESTVELTLHTPRDVGEILGRAGWRMSGVWGGWGREALTADRRKLVVLAAPAG